MTYKPQTVIRGPWPTEKMFSSVVSKSVDRFDFDVPNLSVQDKVIEFLGRYPMQTATQIADAISINKSTVKSALSALIQHSKVAWNNRESEKFRRARHYRIAT